MIPIGISFTGDVGRGGWFTQKLIIEEHVKKQTKYIAVTDMLQTNVFAICSCVHHTYDVIYIVYYLNF
ncbi:hypothetical protein HLI_15460 [Halobacillus litoralis]|uniref:Uncharacterized protein n=1 Tax=Halobacillus litoralis TaxID=45668 RepID=A0A410MFR4_9BACI|nr:hypothetical protein HLI_15460 [Halobacillus litoralis]